MTVFFESHCPQDIFPFSPSGVAETVLSSFMEITDCPYECQVEVTLADTDEIHDLNREFRGIDRPTDVLSFPAFSYDPPGAFDLAEEDEAGAFDPDSGELLLGDVVICAGKVLSQAEEYGHSVKREYAFLLAHSLLHLIGYDHMEDEERETMESLQETILQNCGITRE